MNELADAVRHLSQEAAAAIELYVLEQGPLRIEEVDGWHQLVVKQDVRLRLKTAEEIREVERDRIRTAVLEHYKEAPLAAEPIVRIIDGKGVT